MEAASLAGASRRHQIVTTRNLPDRRPPSDLRRRDFQAAVPNELRVADITFVQTAAAFLFRAVVLDVWSRRIVGWAFAANLKPASCMMPSTWRWRSESRPNTKPA